MQRTNEWFFSRGTLSNSEWETVVDDGIPGWQHTGIRIGVLADGGTLRLDAGDVERVFVPLSGSFTIEAHNEDVDPESGDPVTVELQGRSSVFDGPTDVFYLGAGSSATVQGAGRIAVAEAPTGIRRPSHYVSRDEVPVELRGAGRSSRQVHNFGTPQALDAAKLIVCEVITPAENWSSYPAHKHDEHVAGHESRLEEIYYFETAVTRGAEAPASADPFGLFSTSSSAAGTIDTNSTVRSGDVALVPFGYHGPAVAAPGYDLYYLNVMAGPDDERVWNITDDPAHAWIRTSWDGQQFDDRLPYTPLSKGPRR